jgi:hypothetical protein
LVWCIWKFRSNWSWKCNINYFTIDCIRLYCHFIRLNVAERLGFRFRSIIIYSCKCMLKYCMENFKSNNFKIWIRNIILRFTDCINTSFNNKTFKRRSVISSVLSFFKSNFVKSICHNINILLSNLSARISCWVTVSS